MHSVQTESTCLKLSASSAIQEIEFKALDGYVLHGMFYPAQHSAKATLLIASATGVPQQFYRRFAQYMSGLDYQVFSFDYRGIGQSAPKKLKGFRMNYLDWGHLDLAGAVEYLAKKDLPILMIGHSYGGQALGMLPNSNKITACYTVGTGVGWAGYMPFAERMKVGVMWNLIFPAVALRYGFIPWSKMNMGADLPLGVYQQWKKWCKNSEYFFADPEYHFLTEQYAKIKTPIYAVTSIDDEWAMPISRNAFMKYYSQASVQYIDLIPQNMGMSSIGHMGYFRQNAEKIWQQMHQTFEQHQ